MPTTLITSAIGGIFRTETDPRVAPNTMVAMGIAACPIKSTGTMIAEGIKGAPPAKTISMDPRLAINGGLIIS